MLLVVVVLAGWVVLSLALGLVWGLLRWSARTAAPAPAGRVDVPAPRAAPVDAPRARARS